MNKEHTSLRECSHRTSFSNSATSHRPARLPQLWRRVLSSLEARSPHYAFTLLETCLDCHILVVSGILRTTPK